MLACSKYLSKKACFIPFWALQRVSVRLLTKHWELSFFTFPLSNHVGRHAHIYSCIALLGIWDGQLCSTNLTKNACNYSSNALHCNSSSKWWIIEYVIHGMRVMQKAEECSLRSNPPWSCHLWGQDELYLSSRRWWVQDARVEADTRDSQSPQLLPPHPVGSVWSHRVTLWDKVKGVGVVTLICNGCSFSWFVLSFIRFHYVNQKVALRLSCLGFTDLFYFFLMWKSKDNFIKQTHRNLSNLSVFNNTAVPLRGYGLFFNLSS